MKKRGAVKKESNLLLSFFTALFLIQFSYGRGAMLKAAFPPEAHRTASYLDPVPAAPGSPHPPRPWSHRWTWLTLLLSESHG